MPETKDGGWLLDDNQEDNPKYKPVEKKTKPEKK